MKFNNTIKEVVEVKYLKVSVDVRYWDDAEINGETYEDGTNVPFKNGSLWEPIIELETGAIKDWPKGFEASFHFKVCDRGSYYLLDESMNTVVSIENNYVPDGLCHGDEGYGDYIIFSVDKDGKIHDYKNKIDINEWLDEQD